MTNTRYIDGNNLYGGLMLFDRPTEKFTLEDEMFIKELKN